MTMEFQHEIIERIRKDNDVPDRYNTYKVGFSIWTTMINHSIVDIRMNTFDVCNINSENEKISVREQDGKLYGEGFMIVNCTYYRFDEEVSFVLLFTEDIEGFYKKYLKGKYEPPKDIVFNKGVFKPCHTMVGWKLVSVPLGDTLKPILNHNLFKILDKEIEAFGGKKEIYKEVGADYKRGILLYGGAGNGKTSFIKHLLHRKKKDAICVLIDSNDDTIGFMEVMAKEESIKDTLKIVVLEDIDGMSNQVRSYLLNFLDGIHTMHNFIFIATTNFIEKVDVALKERPSRFDSIFKIGVPNAESRKKLLQLYFKELKNSELDKCIVASKGFSGAFFKEFYIMSKLNGWDALTAINEVIRRRNLGDEDD